MKKRTELAPGYTISPLIVGGWQLSNGHAREPCDVEAVFEALDRLVEAGFTTFDCADIYTGVEELLGEFSRRYRRRFGGLVGGAPAAVPGLQIHTKFVPDLEALPEISKAYVEKIIDRSLRRLGIERLDLVQFSWWDYQIPRFVETALWLAELRQAGKIRHLGVTNFDVPHLRQMVEAGVRFVCHQVQYSLLDQRPENGMVEYCRQQGIKLLCYGTLAGGFLSDRYLGAAEPVPPYANRSLTKYKLIIDEFGGWGLFQELLEVLQGVAEKHGVGIGCVAIRYLIDRPQVAGAIVGARNAHHLEENLAVFELRLDGEDRARIHSVVDRRRGPAGDVFSLERVAGGPHATIMKVNLNREASG
ncbi:MAG: aldo/keto reductase [Acidobacteriota bacterium]